MASSSPSSGRSWHERLLDWLLRPAPGVPESKRRQSRLLAWLLLALLLAALAFLILVLVDVNIGLSLRNAVGSIVAGAGVLMLLAFALNRAGHYRGAASLTVGLTALGAWAIIISSGRQLNPLFLTYPVIAVLLSSVLLSARTTALVAAVQLIGLAPILSEPVYGSAFVFDALLSGVLVVIAIIRERDAAQIEQQTQSLAESEERFRNAIDNSAIGMALVGPDGRWLRVNRALCAIVGYEEAELLARTFQDITHPDDLQADLNSLRRLVAGEIQSYQTEKRYFHKDGRIVRIHLTVSTVRGPNGDPAYFISQIEDITSRKQAEEALQQSSERYRQMLEEAERLRQFNASVAEVMAEGLVIEDTHGRFTLVNPRVEQLLGYSAAELLGQHWSMIVAPRLHSQVAEQSAARPAGRASVYEGVLLSKAGREIPALISAAPLFAGGRFTGTLVTFADISELKRAQTELEAREERYRQLYREAQRQAQELALLDQVRTALARELDLAALFRMVVEAIQQTFGYTLVSLYLLEGDEVVLQHQVGYHDVITRIPVTRGVVGQVVRTGASVLVADVHREADFIGVIDGVVSEVCVPLRDQGKVVGVLNVESTQGVNLTEADLALVEALGLHVSLTMARVRLYAEARAAETRLRTLVEQIPAITYIISFESGQPALYVSPQIEQILGFTPAEWTNDPELWRKQLHPADRERVLAEDEHSLATGEPFVSEYRILARDGRVVWLHDETRWVRDKEGRPLFAQGIEFDVTERKQAEETVGEANARLTRWLAEQEERTRELSVLNEMSSLFQTCRSAEEAYVVVAQLAPQLFPGGGGALYLTRSSRNLLLQMAAWGEAPPQGELLQPNDCWALRRGRLYNPAPGGAGLRCPHVREQPAAYLCVPLMAQGETRGVLHLQFAEGEGGSPEAADGRRQLAQTLADGIALALANLNLRESLQQQSIRDPLTGLFNRRYLEETLERETSRAARSHQPLGIIMLDLDHFKQFNDTYGHAAGDALLGALGQFLGAHVRGADIPCRYGGEEFTLILPEAALDTLRTRADQLRRGVKRLKVKHLGQPLGLITFSLGVAVFPQHGASGEAVLRAADAALYQAKRQGRDRVVVAEQTAPPPDPKPKTRKARP